jgi:DNA polymerase I-like protein with 3'-5' exonuclease and polymerase domains
VKRYLYDTESDGFVATSTVIHCISIRDVDTEDHWSYGPDQIQAALDKLTEADLRIGHNIQRHDEKLIKKLYPSWEPKAGSTLLDTMILARLKFPNVKATDPDLVRAGKMPAGTDYQGKHNLAAWGYRLGEHKGDYAALRRAQAMEAGLTSEQDIAKFVWGTYTKDMHEYMDQDTLTNLKLLRHLDPDNYSPTAIELEHRIAVVCDAMEQAGVPFDTKKAAALHVDLVTQSSVIEERLREQFGFWYAPEHPGKPARDFEGKPYTSYEASEHTPKVNNKTRGVVKGQTFSKIKKVSFNPGSRDHIAHVLKAKGWKPKKFTDGGKAAFDEEVLISIMAEFPEMEAIDRYFMLEKRISQLATGKQALMLHVKEDGRIHGVINPMGAITSRASHFHPNLGQVPNSASPYGPEFRELFYAPPGWKFLGADMSGLELRGLGHYLARLDGGKYMLIVTNGDPHWLHAQVMGLAEGDRDKENKLHTLVREDGSKRFIYAYIYGAWDDMCGQILFDCLIKAKRDCGPEGEALFNKFFPKGIKEDTLRNAGRKVRAAFMTRIDGYGKLQEAIQAQVKRFGWVYGLDERKIPTRSEHSALNFLIQSCGAILCKRWVCDVYEELCSKYKWGWDGDFVMGLWCHDEMQLCVREGLEEEIASIIVRLARASGEPYAFRGPLDSSYAIGRNWRETH